MKHNGGHMESPPEVEYEMNFFAPGSQPVNGQFVPAIACFIGSPFAPYGTQKIRFITLKLGCPLPDWQDAKFIAERDYHAICDECDAMKFDTGPENFSFFEEKLKKNGYVRTEQS